MSSTGHRHDFGFRRLSNDDVLFVPIFSSWLGVTFSLGTPSFISMTSMSAPMRKASCVLLLIALVLALGNVPILIHRLFEPETAIFWDKETVLKTLLYWGSGLALALGSGLWGRSQWHQLSFAVGGVTLMLMGCEGASRSSEIVIAVKLGCSIATITVLLGFARRVYPQA